MISVKEAKEIIRQHVQHLTPVSMPIAMAAGLMLAEDVYALMDIPAFAQSSMDGYAINFSDKNSPLVINGEMAAGLHKPYNISLGEAVRIFTGAPLPSFADTIVMQEKVIVESGKIIIKNDDLKKGDFVRNQGAEIKKGALALPKFAQLTPPALGFLAGIGIDEVIVFPPPKVSIIITGNELQKQGNELEFGQVYESNSVTLTAALKHCGVADITVFEAKDEPDTLIKVLSEALSQADLVLLTGGVSVGDYDFVLYAANAFGINQHFHKVKQKPGKPLYFGTKENKIVFGLPGNPSSVLACWYEYVLEAMDIMLQKKSSIKETVAVLQNDFSKPAGLTHFLKAFFEDGKVTVLSSQASFLLNSFAVANCFVLLNETTTEIKKGETVSIHIFPF